MYILDPALGDSYAIGKDIGSVDDLELRVQAITQNTNLLNISDSILTTQYWKDTLNRISIK